MGLGTFWTPFKSRDRVPLRRSQLRFLQSIQVGHAQRTLAAIGPIPGKKVLSLLGEASDPVEEAVS